MTQYQNTLFPPRATAEPAVAVEDAIQIVDLFAGPGGLGEGFSSSGDEGWVREVYLRGHGQPWVFARSVAAKSSLQEGGLNMDELGTRSLGELLFSDQAFERGALQVCHYPRHWLPQVDQVDHLWARRSRFVRGALSVLVAEVFLPKLWTALSARSENN